MYFCITVFSLFVIVCLLIFRPVPYIKESRALTVEGVVKDLYESGTCDVSILLKDSDRRYYINRGLENGLDIDSLKSNLIGEAVVLKYPKYWTPLDWNNEVRHTCYLEKEGVVVYNGFKK
jgi:hypothetical protein